MLASITPLGERGRNAHWMVTVVAFAVGATAAGAALGAALAAVGQLLLPGDGSARWRLILLAGALLAAIALDLGHPTVPGPRRQVNEHWMDEYRGWVYGLGFGVQLGLGVTTVVSSAATYVALLAAVLAPGVAGGAAIMGCFGAVRGLTLLAGARIRTPPQLLALHHWLARWRERAAWAGATALAAVLVAALAAGAT
jgi:MFS family permease